MKLNGKTLARLAAVQLIYQYQINQEEQSLSLLMSNIQEYYSSTTSDHDFFPYKNTGDIDQNFIKRLEFSSEEKTPLRVKLGIDPTGTDIHIGHSILFRKLRAFQDAGHTAVLIIGDFTARIGDPTGKSKTRIQLSKDEVESNALNYLEQLGLGKEPKDSLIDFSTPGRLEIRRNSEWLESLNLSKVIELLSNSTVGQMLAKEDFNNRYKSCLLYTSPSPRDGLLSRMPSSA